MDKKIIVIVDAYSSGNLIAPEFKRRNYSCIHIQSKAQIPKVIEASFKRSDFSENIIFDGDFTALVNIIKRYNPIAIIAGTETGVVLADRLGNAIGVKSNHYETANTRRDKYLMQEAVRQKGLRAIKQIQTNRFEEALNWVHDFSKWPVVVKPLNSAGTDSVAICANKAELLCAFNAIIGKENQIGLISDCVLVQEFIKGTEYIVDTVSVQGKHYVTDMWRYHKISNNSGNFIYDAEELLPPEGTVQDSLEKYTFKMPDAIGIEYGVAHNEIMLDADGPVLIESGARLNGGGVQPMIEFCTDGNPVQFLADVHVSPITLNERFGRRYKMRKHGLYVYFISETEGILKDMSCLDEIYKLNSFSKIHMNVKTGEKIQHTRDLFTSPGHVELIHESSDVVWNDYNKIRAMEKAECS